MINNTTGIRKPMTYKKLVKQISEIQDWDDICRAEGEINFAFEHEKITWDDHETLYKICNALTYAVETPERFSQR